METTMNKVATLDSDTYSRIAKDGKLGAALREKLGIPKNKKMGIGDTMIRIGKFTNVGDVFKYIQNKREIFYVVINPINEELAFCYSIYPC